MILRHNSLWKIQSLKRELW